MSDYEARGAEGWEEMTIMHRGVFMILPSKQVHLQEYVFDGPPNVEEAIDQALVTLLLRKAELLGAIHQPPTSDQPTPAQIHG